jgi:L-asparaginase
MTPRTDVPRVGVFTLGGTIASTNEPGSQARGVTPRLGAQELVSAVPQLNGVAEIEAITFRQTASGDLTLGDIAALAREITTRLESGTTAAVVTQGTDTIEETAFALDLLVSAPNPVVVTGAMRNPTLAGADGPANILAAVQVASSSAARDLGTLVVFNDEVHAARFVRKTHTSSPATFHSVTTGPLGWVTEGRPRIAFRLAALPGVTLSPDAQVPAVALLRISLGDDGRLINSIASLDYAGLVVEAFGGGHVPAHTVPALERLASRIPVVLASRTGAGEVLRETYGFAGSERDLLSRGLLCAGYLDGLKARVMLSLWLASGADTESIRAQFEKVAAL